MKRMAIGIASATVLIALIIGVLPAAASEPEINITEAGNYSGQSCYDTSDFSGSAAEPDGPSLTTPTGEHLTFTISATDPDNDSLVYSASNLPPGATFDPQTGTFSWMPGYEQAGSYHNVHFEVSDGQFTDSEEITITVTNFNRPPVLDFIGDKLTSEEELVQFTVQAADPDGEQLTHKASNLPQGAIFDPQTRTFSWKPGSGQQGTYPGIRFEVSDGDLSDYEDITITVQARTYEEAIFSVDSLRVRPGKVSAGKQVRISVLATNSGTVAGNYEVVLRINGTIENNKILTLSPGATEEVDFVVVKDIPGVYAVDVNGLSDSFLVREVDNGRPAKKNSVMVALSRTVGWIRTIMNEGGDI